MKTETKEYLQNIGNKCRAIKTSEEENKKHSEEIKKFLEGKK
jgi:hypothetical protein